MFENLKKKISGFIGSFSANEKEKIEAEAAASEVAAREAPKGVRNEEGAPESKGKPTQPNEGKQTLQPKISMATKLKGAFFKTVELKDADVDSFIDQFKLILLKSDVAYETTDHFAETLRKRLVGMRVDSRSIDAEIRNSAKAAMLDILNKGADYDLIESAKAKIRADGRPFKMLFVGPNGAGKTTTIAKIAKLFINEGLSCIIAASDTFRAAAIEQTAMHAEKLGIEVVKSSYGADPASVAFDAIAHARAKGIDIVLIDSAGRQETNKSLIEEMKKMARVAKPDMKVFVGEGIAGNALLEQVRQFNEAIKLDGIILTKLDVDAKGGNTLSILSETSIPILFFGTGEKYEDLVKYKPEIIADSIF
ncbi:MAG: signal recognition particle-docking protein FtsY [Candidatus Micrarchaeaceae archaeon]